MRVVIDARYISANLSGIGRYTLNLLRGIVRLRPSIRLTLLAAEPQRLPDDVLASPLIDAVLTTGRPQSPMEQVALPRTLRRIGPDIFHSMDGFAPVLARCRRIITIHDLIPLVCRDAGSTGLKGRLAPLWRQWLRLQCRSASAVLTDSQHSADDIRRILRVHPSRLHVVSPGVEPTPPMASSQIDEHLERLGVSRPFALYVGRRDPYKNVTALVEAFAAVRGRVPGHALVIAGYRDPRFAQPEQAAARLGLGEAVRFLGHVSDPQLRALYHAAEALALPSRYEGFGLTALEAMSCGTPVLASDCTSLPEVLSDAALLVNATDPARLAEGLLRILLDPDERARRRAAGPARAARFTVRAQAARTLECYRRTLDAAPEPPAVEVAVPAAERVPHGAAAGD